MDETYLEDRRIFLSDASADMDEGRYDDAIALADARLKLLPGDMERLKRSLSSGMLSYGISRRCMRFWETRTGGRGWMKRRYAPI
ncbi:MAG: hypothetical protein JRE40_01835 [Deltaproteobacteria bacterium]|nr:hypothetical protein [Deltaproteobacteria bacterium]